MKESVLRTKSKEFAKDIIILCRKMKSFQVEHALVNQLLRSGTSVGANIHEAQYAQGTKDFVSKLEIALKECNESDYWIDLLFETNSMEQVDYNHLKSKIVELRRMLVASVTTVKQRHNQEKTK
ncbi:four helix bundle protein [Ruminococcus sp.]|uniref:four helix bundle protein n=1 Tax=Ruminococcus sp. TaxID=41978 RepID=UPI002E80BE61|nr:four helix bundle protein [Ruminococcus sp.]MEE3493076.1 four helix bundle protein [Ruminococcus sp.]